MSKPTAELSAAARPPLSVEDVHLNAVPGLQGTQEHHSSCEQADATCSPAWGVCFSVEVLPLPWEMHRNCQKASSLDLLCFKSKIKSCLFLTVDMKYDLLYNVGELDYSAESQGPYV